MHADSASFGLIPTNSARGHHFNSYFTKNLVCKGLNDASRSAHFLRILSTKIYRECLRLLKVGLQLGLGTTKSRTEADSGRSQNYKTGPDSDPDSLKILISDPGSSIQHRFPIPIPPQRWLQQAPLAVRTNLTLSSCVSAISSCVIKFTEGNRNSQIQYAFWHYSEIHSRIMLLRQSIFSQAPHGSGTIVEHREDFQSG